MTWTAHIDKIRKLIAPLVGIISKIRHIVPKSILLLLYNSMILPHICYCIEIWGNTFSSLLKPLLILQKKVVRFITFSDARAHTAPLFKQLGILNIYKQCEFNTCTFIFDLKNGSFSHSVFRYLDPVPHNYSTRLKTGENFYIPKVNLTLSQHNLKYAATMLWNKLPEPIKTISDRKHFKCQLKDWILNR